MSVLVVGAGLGGVAAALGLGEKGLEPVLVESRPEPAVVGSGIYLASNGIRALQRLGVGADVERMGVPVEQSIFLTAAGKEIARLPTGEQSRALKAPTIGIRRPVVHQVLLDAFGGPVRGSHELEGFDQDGNGVTARFNGGGVLTTDALVGADGINSVVRRHLHAGAAPNFAGYAGWRGLVADGERFVPIGDFKVYWGRGVRFVAYHVGDGYLYWLAMPSSVAGEVAAGERREHVLGRLVDFEPVVRKVVEATEERAIINSDLFDHDPVHRWGVGRVTLLGDAAHAMTPNQGQGACQGFEDAVVLAAKLSTADDVRSGLRAYEDARMKRANALAKESRTIGSLGLWHNRLSVAFRDKVLLRVVLGLIGPRKQARDFAAPF